MSDRDDRLAPLERVFKGADDDPPGYWIGGDSHISKPTWVDQRRDR